MSELEPPMWGIHAGDVGQADSLFKKNYVALGWEEISDLSKLTADREAFKKKVAETYPDAKPGMIPNNAGQLFRFVHELKPGDMIIYPSKRDRQVHIGRVEGTYHYDPSIDAHYPHLRSVSWLGSFPRTRFTQGALNEIGSAITFFQVKTYAQEFRTALHDKKVQPSTVGNAAVVQSIEESSRNIPLNEQVSRSARTHAFISYSHKDREHLDRLRGYLDLYLRGKSVDVWDDTMILTGAKWREHIKQAIDSARVAVLLISVDFLRSKFIREDELPPLLQAAQHDGITIVPIVLDPCPLELFEELDDMQTFNPPSLPVIGMSPFEQKKLWMEVAKLVSDALAGQSV